MGSTLTDTLEILECLVKEVDIINLPAALNDNIQHQMDKMMIWPKQLKKSLLKKFIIQRWTEILENGKCRFIAIDVD